MAESGKPLLPPEDFNEDLFFWPEAQGMTFDEAKIRLKEFGLQPYKVSTTKNSRVYSLLNVSKTGRVQHNLKKKI